MRVKIETEVMGLLTEATRKSEKFEVRLNADEVRLGNSEKDLVLN